MKKVTALFIAMVTIFALCATSLAASRVVSAELHYNDIKITLDGQELIPVDGGGNPVEPFIIDGTTYLPVRGIASALGLDVQWDQATSTVILTSPKDETDVAPSGSGSGSGSANNSGGTTTAPSGNNNGNGGGIGNADNFYTYDNEDQQHTEAQWVLNTSSMKVHYPTCSQVKKIAPQNYSTSNASLDTLKSRGYTTCGVCFG